MPAGERKPIVTARDIMTPRCEWVNEDAMLVESAKRLVQLGVNVLPVRGEDGRLIGILRNQDILKSVARGLDPSRTGTRAVSSPALAIGADDPLESALAKMKHHKVGVLPVLDGADLVGAISQADIANSLRLMRQVGSEGTVPLLEEISDEDVMFDASVATYLQIGESAVQCIKLSMLAAGKRQVNRILDLPSGHGRVLRVLKATFPQAELTACDIDTEAVDFCARAFGARPIYSKAEPGEIELEGPFDLIWCGSLLTHIDSDRWPGFLRLFESALSADGLLVFTTHGRHVADRLGEGASYGLSEAAVQTVLRSYERDGFGYAGYPAQRDYGISVSAAAWVCALLSELGRLRLLLYTEKAWAQQQDVVACAPLKG